MRFHTQLEVNFSVLEENFKLLKKKAPSNEVIFMIKANAYGHGLAPVAQFSWSELQVGAFGVASLGEGLALRKELPSMRANIYVFSDTGLFWDDLKSLYLEYNLIPVIGSLQELKEFCGDKSFSHVPLTIKLDTGMNRLGLQMGEFEETIKLLRNFGRRKIHHLMTHFSSSFLPYREGDRTCKQYSHFKEAKKELAQAGFEVEASSCANSGAIEQNIALEESHVRPGLMLYGPASCFESSWEGKNISLLKTHVLRSSLIKKGAPVGYGGHVAHQDGLLVYLPVGYGDGILTSSSKSDWEVEGWKGRVLGRVNMDLTAFLFPAEASKDFKRGKEVCLWTRNQKSVQEIAAGAKTVPYNIFTAISSRVPRSYIYKS